MVLVDLAFMSSDTLLPVAQLIFELNQGFHDYLNKRASKNIPFDTKMQSKIINTIYIFIIFQHLPTIAVCAIISYFLKNKTFLSACHFSITDSYRTKIIFLSKSFFSNYVLHITATIH